MVCSDQKRLNFELINKLNRYKMNTIKSLTRYTLYTLCVICLASCTQKERPKPKQVESLKVLMAKNIETVNATALSSGYTRYMLAFSDGWTERTSFGYYTCLKIGDTIRFVKDEGDNDYWLRMKPNCN